MTQRITVMSLCLAFAPLSALWAALPAESVRESPYVVSATRQPTDVKLPSAPAPQELLRLKDPSAGGVLAAGFEGSAVLLGPPEEGSFSARVSIEFLDANSSLEVRVIDANGAELNSVQLFSPKPGRWSGSICEVAASQNSGSNSP